MSLRGNVLNPVVKSVLITLGLIKKMFRSGVTTLIISNEEINDIMKIVKSLEESDLLIKGVREITKNKTK